MKAPQQELNERAKAALAARDRQYRHYCRTKIAELNELCAENPFGQQLTDFIVNIRSFTIDDEERFFSYIFDSHERWLGRADEQVRKTAMSIAAHRIMELRIAAGLLPFDDPLPGSDDDMFQIVRQVFEPH